MGGYLYWQFVSGPLWVAAFSLNLQRVLLRSFSVSEMLRTLIAHWHRDAVPYRGGSISSYFLAFAWNIISRVVGFVVRSMMLVLWMASAIITLVLCGAAAALFLLWPFAIIVVILLGALMMFA